MAYPRSLPICVALATAARCLAALPDKALFLQQGVEVGARGTLSALRAADDTPSAAATMTFEKGETVQVKFEGSTNWVDCSVTGRADTADRYNIFVPNMLGGLMREKEVQGVPTQLLRRVFKDVEVNIEQGENASSWVECLITGRGDKPNSYNIEMTTDFPGFTIANVPTHLLRDGENRRKKATNLQEMIAENEAVKNQLFWVNPMKPQGRPEEVMLKAREDTVRYVQSQAIQAAWAEMARRAEEEEAQRQASEAKKRAWKEEAKNKKLAAARAANERQMMWEEEEAKTNPLIALKVKARKMQEAQYRLEEESLMSRRREAEKKQKAKEEARRREEARMQRFTDSMEQVRLGHITQQKALAEQGGVENNKEFREGMEAFKKVELGLTRKRLISQEEMLEQIRQDEAKYSSEEEALKRSRQARALATTRKSLQRAVSELQSVLEGGSAASQGTARQQLRSMLKEAELVGVEARELDRARLGLVQALGASAREAANRALESRKAQDLQNAITDGTSKYTESERLWGAITDESLKAGVQRLDATELQAAKDALPDATKQEKLFTEVRSRIGFAKKARNSAKLEAAIGHAMASELPDEEVQAAHDALEQLKAQQEAEQSIGAALRSKNADALEAAMGQAREAKIDGWKLKNVRRSLERLRAQPQKPQQ